MLRHERGQLRDRGVARRAAIAMSQGSPFALVARLLRRGSGITGGEPLVVRQQKLRARVARNVHEEADVTRVTEFLGEIASIPFPDTDSLQLRAARQDPTLMGDQMRRAFCDLVLAETQVAPFVLVLEDLHWGDLPSVNLLDAALRAASDRAFMVLAVARGEVHDAFPQLWAQRSLQEVRLGPLVRRAGEKLVRDVLGDDLPPPEMARLLDRAAGNAFYLEELIRAFAEGTGRAQGRSATIPPPGTVPPPPTSSTAMGVDQAWSLPTTVLAMVEARLQRLDPMARRVMRAASVFGEAFWRGGVLALTGGQYKATEIDDWLSDLTRREIIQRRDTSRFELEAEYAFRHAIVRDAAYQMLTTEDQALGHSLAASFLERSGEDDAMVLGEHFERGGNDVRAAAFYARAAHAALEGNDFVAAKRGPSARSARARTAATRRARQAAARHRRGIALDGRPRSRARARDRCARRARRALRRLVCRRCRSDRSSDDARTWRGGAQRRAPGGRGDANRADDDRAGDGDVAHRDRARLRGSLRRRGRAPRADRSGGGLHRGRSDRARLLALREHRARGLAHRARARDRSLAKRGDAFDVVGDVRNATKQRQQGGRGALRARRVRRKRSSCSTQRARDAERLGLATVANDAALRLAGVFMRTNRFEQAVAVASEIIAACNEQRDRGGEGRARGYLASVYYFGARFDAAADEAEARARASSSTRRRIAPRSSGSLRSR